jgi:hypothetical protein
MFANSLITRALAGAQERDSLRKLSFTGSGVTKIQLWEPFLPIMAESSHFLNTMRK